ncbi:MAG: HEPN domain-containing protein [Chloroflexota bacterium]|nr:MAG: HEPN domain-containing protein [Chloroflexota bacterium]
MTDSVFSVVEHYAALALLQSISRAPSKHAGVISLFDTEFVAKGTFSKDLSKDFHRAFELCQTADHRALPPITPQTALETWQRAARFVEAIQRYFEEREKQTMQ